MADKHAGVVQARPDRNVTGTIANLPEAEELITVEAPCCPVCGGNGSVHYEELRDRLYRVPGVWSLSRCESCDSLWLNPRPHDDEIHKCYSEYLTHEGDEKTPHSDNAWLKVKDLFLAGRRREIESYDAMFLLAERQGRLLDVGCGNGSFLCSMRDRGWDVMGLEPDPKAVRIARERFGLDVVAGSLEKADLPSSSFDAITLSHVIEHVPDPSALLGRCFQLLKSGGRLAITTPNINSLGHHFFKHCWGALEPPRHLVIFCPRSLLLVTKNAGFHILMAGTGERTASGIFMMSSLISSFGRVVDTPLPTYQTVFRTLRRMGFVFVEHWGKKVFKDIGEEIGILAIKA